MKIDSILPAQKEKISVSIFKVTSKTIFNSDYYYGYYGGREEPLKIITWPGGREEKP